MSNFPCEIPYLFPFCQHIIRLMSRYYHFKSHGVSIHAEPGSLLCKLWPFPFLTGDPIAIKISTKGKYDTAIENISFSLEKDGKSVKEVGPYPVSAQYKPTFTRISDAGQYEIIMNCRQPMTIYGPFSLKEKVATIHMVDNWKPLTTIFTIVVTAIISVIATLFIEYLAHRYL